MFFALYCAGGLVAITLQTVSFYRLVKDRTQVYVTRLSPALQATLTSPWSTL